mmetsp:Transcript_22552/g.72559  ORF Transcript_22552/g.72559 Transcript_22552/m.72559 type:complete len:210 (-) Transcript_22552:340-969(-)
MTTEMGNLADDEERDEADGDSRAPGRRAPRGHRHRRERRCTCAPVSIPRPLPPLLWFLICLTTTNMFPGTIIALILAVTFHSNGPIFFCGSFCSWPPSRTFCVRSTSTSPCTRGWSCMASSRPPASRNGTTGGRTRPTTSTGAPRWPSLRCRRCFRRSHARRLAHLRHAGGSAYGVSRAGLRDAVRAVPALSHATGMAGFEGDAHTPSC